MAARLRTQLVGGKTWRKLGTGQQALEGALPGVPVWDDAGGFESKRH